MMYISMARRELLRKRVFLVTVVLTVLFLLLFGYGVRQLGGEELLHSESKLEQYSISFILLYLGLFFGHMITAFFVLFTTMGTISSEKETGLLLAVLARPVPRWRVYLGKWTGYAFWIVVYNGFLFWSLVLIVHLGVDYPLSEGLLIKSFLLYEWIGLILLSMSMLGSVYLPTLGNGVACALLFGIALFSGMTEGVLNHAGEYPGLERFVLLVSLVIPTDSVFRRGIVELLGGPDSPLASIGSEMGPFLISFIPSNGFLLYTAAYVAFLLAWGCRAFSKKDI